MNKSKNGFLIGYDTSKRLKHSREKIAILRKNGLSLRQISNELNIPFGSIHYILRTNGLYYTSTVTVNQDYLTRSQAKTILNITDSQFDYYANKYKNECKRVNNKVYISRFFLEDRVLNKKGYEKLSDSKIQQIQDLSLIYNHTQVAKYAKVTKSTVIKYSLKNTNLKD